MRTRMLKIGLMAGAAAAMGALVAPAVAGGSCGSVRIGFGGHSGHHGHHSHSGFSVGIGFGSRGCGKFYSGGHYVAYPRSYGCRPTGRYYPSCPTVVTYRSTGRTTHYGRPYSYGGSYCRSHFAYDDCAPSVVVIERDSSPPPVRVAPPPPQNNMYPTNSMPGEVLERNDPPYNESMYDARERQMRLGWALLGEGSPARAQQVFSGLCSSDLNNGVPKIGYAMSAAMQGDHRTATWAMRRAFGMDPDGLAKAPITGRVRERLEEAAQEYERLAEAPEADVDTLFMAAATKHLLGEPANAMESIDRALAAGDATESAVNLKRLAAAANEAAQRPLADATSGTVNENMTPPPGGMYATR